MLKVLVPVDGSTNALGAVRHAIEQHRRQRELEVHLINVQPRYSRYITRFLARSDRQSWRDERYEVALAGAKALLADASVPHHSHQAVGDSAQEICNAAKRLHVNQIVMGTARKNSLARMLQDSVTNRVLEATPVPVEVIAGTAVSKWERWGMSAGALGAGGLLLLAID